MGTTAARLTLDSVVGLIGSLAESTAAIGGGLSRSIAAQSIMADEVITLRKDVTAIRYDLDNRSRTSTPHATAKENAPKKSTHPRAVSDPTGNDAASSARLDSLCAEWAAVKPKSPKYDGVTLKLAAVNALRADGVTKPTLYGWIRSGTLMEHANGATPSAGRKAGNGAATVSGRGLASRRTLDRMADEAKATRPVLVAADSSVHSLAIPGYVIEVRPV